MSGGTEIVVVGIGADGWSGLTDAAREAVLGADEVIGSARQLESLPADAPRRHAWPSPIIPLLDELVERQGGRVAVLASGDPMLHGIGATLARRVGTDRLTVISHSSTLALACARLGWAEAEVTLLSTVARSASTVARALQDGRRIVVYGGDAPELAATLRDAGYGPSRFVVLTALGGVDERIVEATADSFEAGDLPALHCVAIECVRAPGTPLLSQVPGLPDAAYEHDGALTKRHVRAATLAALGPVPGGLLWDVGAGSGAIAIEWLRAEPSARAVAIEPRADRAERIERNAMSLGVPALRVVIGEAPAALTDLDPPVAVFLGGGLTTDGLVEACWDRLVRGGRLVANAVTLEGERRLVEVCSRLGGELTRLEVSHAEPIGRFTAWRPALPVVQWSAEKP